tara:strand:- start:2268 stop:2642 length:375 start_codon:yes stop_codon:yes gene_type:complete
MRYIYFEVHRIYTDGEENRLDLISKEIKNANELVHRPDNLSSTGDWGFRTRTSQGIRKIEYKGEIKRIPCELIVDQVWLDLDVYKDKEIENTFDIYTYEDVRKVKFDLRFKKPPRHALVYKRRR